VPWCTRRQIAAHEEPSIMELDRDLALRVWSARGEAGGTIEMVSRRHESVGIQACLAVALLPRGGQERIE
jgi:hypothetical protein